MWLDTSHLEALSQSFISFKISKKEVKCFKKENLFVIKLLNLLIICKFVQFKISKFKDYKKFKNLIIVSLCFD